MGASREEVFHRGEGQPMRTYRVPILLDQEEKVIGGRLSLRQAAYILAGLLAAIGLFSLVKVVAGKGIAGGIAIAIFSAGVALALVEIPWLGMGLDRYLALKRRRASFPTREERRSECFRICEGPCTRRSPKKPFPVLRTSWSSRTSRTEDSSSRAANTGSSWRGRRSELPAALRR